MTNKIIDDEVVLRFSSVSILKPKMEIYLRKSESLL